MSNYKSPITPDTNIDEDTPLFPSGLTVEIDPRTELLTTDLSIPTSDIAFRAKRMSFEAEEIHFVPDMPDVKETLARLEKKMESIDMKFDRIMESFSKDRKSRDEVISTVQMKLKTLGGIMSSFFPRESWSASPVPKPDPPSGKDSSEEFRRMLMNLSSKLFERSPWSKSRFDSEKHTPFDN